MRLIQQKMLGIPAGPGVSLDEWAALWGTEPVEVLDLVQGSLDWKLARSACLTASELPALACESKWAPRNPRELFRVKRGETLVRDNTAMSRGRSLEPIARAMVEDALKMKIPAVTMRKGHLLASLDGWNAENQLLVEIKCPMRAEFCDQVPAHYWGQLAQQAVISGAKRVLFVEYIAGMVQCIEVDPLDLVADFMARYAPILRDNLPHLLNATLPAGEIEERADPEWSAAASHYIECKRIADEFVELADKARDALLELAGPDGGEGEGVKVQYVERAGAVNWKAPAIKDALAAAGVNADDYRGKAIRSARVTLSGEEA